MSRDRGARLLAGLVSLGYLGTAALHSTGYGSVVRQARDTTGTLGQLMPALRLVFSIDLTVLGLIVGLLAVRPTDVARPILAIVGLCPLATAGLQLKFIGFIPPTALLIAFGVLTWASAALWPPRSLLEAAETRRTLGDRPAGATRVR